MESGERSAVLPAASPQVCRNRFIELRAAGDGLSFLYLPAARHPQPVTRTSLQSVFSKPFHSFSKRKQYYYYALPKHYIIACAAFDFRLP